MTVQKETFETVYLQNYGRVFNCVYAVLLHREEAEDAVADTFVKAMAAYGSFDPAKGTVQAWLCRIARNCALDWLRRQKRRAAFLPARFEALGEEDRELAALAQEESVLAARLLRRLRPQERQLLAMRYQMELTNPEIAAILGISPKAVSDRIARALEKCRRIAEEMTDED